jgi:hypothetical protein
MAEVRALEERPYVACDLSHPRILAHGSPRRQAFPRRVEGEQQT